MKPTPSETLPTVESVLEGVANSRAAVFNSFLAQTRAQLLASGMSKEQILQVEAETMETFVQTLRVRLAELAKSLAEVLPSRNNQLH
jgi:hypothetical protein